MQQYRLQKIVYCLQFNIKYILEIIFTLLYLVSYYLIF